MGMRRMSRRYGDEEDEKEGRRRYGMRRESKRCGDEEGEEGGKEEVWDEEGEEEGTIEGSST